MFRDEDATPGLKKCLQRCTKSTLAIRYPRSPRRSTLPPVLAVTCVSLRRGSQRVNYRLHLHSRNGPAYNLPPSFLDTSLLVLFLLLFRHCVSQFSFPATASPQTRRSSHHPSAVSPCLISQDASQERRDQGQPRGHYQRIRAEGDQAPRRWLRLHDRCRQGKLCFPAGGSKMRCGKQDGPRN